MSEMVEKVARAIANSMIVQNPSLVLGADGMSYYDDYDNKWYECLPVARAAIEAMREATDEMLIAGAAFYHDNWRKDHVREDTSTPFIWTAMIDAALKEE